MFPKSWEQQSEPTLVKTGNAGLETSHEEYYQRDGSIGRSFGGPTRRPNAKRRPSANHWRDGDRRRRLDVRHDGLHEYHEQHEYESRSGTP